MEYAFDAIKLRDLMTDRINAGGVCLLYTSDAADERSSVDLGGRRIIKKQQRRGSTGRDSIYVHSTRLSDKRE